MEQEITIINLNGTRYMRIPPNLLKYLEVKEGATIIVKDEIKDAKKFIEVWKK